MKLAFIIMSAVVLVAFITVLVFAINLVKKYRKDKKVDTRKVDAEIDRLLDLDDYELKSYHNAND